MSDRSASSPLAFGCLILFMAPFAMGGVIAGVQAARLAAAGDYGQAAFLGIFALVFGGVGIGGMAAAAFGRRRAAETAALENRHPEAPWLWRKDWASGRIEDSTRGTMWGAWAFAALWNLISGPGALLAAREAMREGNKAALIALVFPLVGIGLLVWAVKATLRYHRYAVSRFELTTRPGVVGRAITGAEHTTTALHPPEGFRVALSCVRRVTRGSGKNRSTHESLLWQEERQVPGQVSRQASGMRVVVPVAFAIPADAEPCERSNPSDCVLWRLEVSASVPGVDYGSSFEVPVFRTAESELPRTEEEEAAVRDPAAPAVYRQPPDSRIQVSTNRRGTEILFPAARNPGAATWLTVFLVLWSGIVWALLHFNAPVLFPIVFGLFGLLLLYGALEMWLRVRRVTAASDSITVATGYLAPARERSYPVSDIAEVTTKIGMQSGGTPYYDVILVRKDGKRVTAGHAVRDKREAEWLAARLTQALGLR
ncbi:MAG: hypothetical protein ACREMX_08100 [Gemmatimonadales bacterium]